jgi:succinylglutamate desuccinylase
MASPSPDEWGPPLWKEMHNRTIDYPRNPSPRDKQEIATYFRNINDRLPCDKCKQHYQNQLNQRAIPVNNRDDLIHWLIDIHNEVNRMNGKRVLSYREARSLYERNYYYWLLIIILLIIILYVGPGKIFKWPFRK